jgi:hypothetical protein
MDRAGPSKEYFSIHDPDFSENIQRLLESESLVDDSPVEDTDDFDDSDADPDFVIENNRQFEDSTTSVSDEDDEALMEVDNQEHGSELLNAVAENTPLPPYFLERMKKTEKGPPNAWNSKHPPRNVRTPQRNIIRTLPGIRGPAKALGNAPEKEDVWRLFFDKDIVHQIVHNTNVKLASARDKMAPGTSKVNYRNTDGEELNALIGMLLIASILKSNNENMPSIFSNDEFSRPIFRATMSEKRYKVLIAHLRFDEAQTRDARKRNNKAAAISQIFEKFISNSQANYSPSAYITIDEMLIPFRGRCGFKVYMPKKPKKYGIKVMCLTDAKTSYLYNGYIYTGQGSDGVGLTEKQRELSIPTQSLVRLCQGIYGSNRNITADNWFSSIEGVDELKKRNLTYVGTLRKDKRCIPTEFLPSNSRPVQSTLYGFRKDATLLSFVPKKNRSVCLISSMHNTIESNEENKKPEMICFYNRTKAGVDILDMKCAVFSSNRKTRRWPLAVFYRILNICSVNSFIVFLSYSGTPMMNRFEFIKSLGKDLIVPHLKKRLTIANLPRDLKMDIMRILGNNAPVVENLPDDRLPKRKTCEKCPPGSDRKTQHRCIMCKLAICGQCQRRVCTDCATKCV